MQILLYLILFWVLVSSPFLFLLFLFWMFAISPRTMNRPSFARLMGWDYAHRGYYSKDQTIPENSLPAFARAVENKFGVELDVHLTKDGKLAVLHDENLKRMCGADLNLSDLTGSELKDRKLAGTENSIPLFTDVLKVINGKIPMVIEVKPYGGNISALCERLCTELEGYSGVYCMESFDPRAVYWFKKHRPGVVRGQLSMRMSGYGKDVSRPVAFVASNLLANFLTRPDFIAYCVEDRRNVSFRLCKRLYGVQEFSWTIHTPKDAAEVQKTGGLIIFEYFDPRK